ncbi:hypothetical protein Lal_00004356 [Lupinus albus]|nr:hypothetical protein Lal_00004356 [Lupinus albus]
MYHFERYMKILKGYVKNRSRLDGCIAEQYIVEEALDFCTGYLEDDDFICIPKPRYAKGTSGEGITGKEILSISRSELEQAHLYVLHNVDEVEPYVERHMEMLKKSNLRFMQVDLNRPRFKNGPFILASQTQQEFYVSDPANKKWSIVLLTNKIFINNIDDQEDIDAEDDPLFGISLSHDITTNDDLYTRSDHDEGL